jgi:CRISPR-associated protein Csm2
MNTNDFKPEWISQGITVQAVNFAEKLGEFLCDKQHDGRAGRLAMTTSQIRNFFGEIKRIQAKGYDKEISSFLLIRPKLAYAEARVKSKTANSRIEDFRKVMEKAHVSVQNSTQFQNFVDFLEAVLAYHKAAGGKD